MTCQYALVVAIKNTHVIRSLCFPRHILAVMCLCFSLLFSSFYKETTTTVLCLLFVLPLSAILFLLSCELLLNSTSTALLGDVGNLNEMKNNSKRNFICLFKKEMKSEDAGSE